MIFLLKYMEEQDKIKEMTKQNVEKKKCFIIMPISDPDDYKRGHFNRVYDYLIKPACEVAGFEPVRADETSKSNMIIIDILKKVVNYDIAICDISSRNPNVFYELGFRQAFNKKTVLIKDEKTNMPFDISSIRTLPYDENLRVDEVKKSVLNLSRCIKETYDNEENDANSLIQLLSIETAVLPEKMTLKEDTSIILNELKEIKETLKLSRTQNSALTSKKSETIEIGDGETAKIGDRIYDNEWQLLGELKKITSYHIIIENSEGHIKLIDTDSPALKQLNRLPL